MLLINVVVELHNRTEEDPQSRAIRTDATSDIMCFGQGQAIWYLTWSFFPSPPICLLILDVCIIWEWELEWAMCYPHFAHSW